MIAKNRDPRVYVEDILKAIRKIGEYTVKGKKTFLFDEMIQDAVVYQLAIIGEAASKLPLTMKKKYADVPWKDVIGLRSVIIHDYANINLLRIWNTVEKDLPALQSAVQLMLADSIQSPL